MGRGRIFFRIIVGGYLAYLGFGLVKDAVADKPENYIWFALAGIAFIAVGLAWLLLAVRTLIKGGGAEMDTEESDDEEENQENAIESDKMGETIEEADENDDTGKEE